MNYRELIQLGRRIGKYALLSAGIALAMATSAQAHGIAGNRFFPGTLNFDDPAVADEFSFTTGGRKQQVDGVDASNNLSTISFARRLTPTWSIGVDSGYLRRNLGGVHQSGSIGTDVVLKTRLYEDDLNETLAAASLSYGFAGTGAKRIGENRPATLTPTFNVGQGFGALPDSMAWLRPFGVTASVSLTVPLSRTSNNLTYDFSRKQYVDVQTHNATTVHWGFAIQYSTLYLTDRFKPGILPQEEPLHQFIPLIEFAFDSTRGQKTTGTVNPGFAYVKDTWQVATEVVVPLNRDSGHGVGVNFQMLFFLDDFMPSVFGKPLLSR